MEKIIKAIKSLLDWFIKLGNRNKIEVLLILISMTLGYHITKQEEIIKEQENERQVRDSIYNSRLNLSHLYHQDEIKKCNEERIKDQIEQNKKWQKRFEDLFINSDKVYQNISN